MDGQELLAQIQALQGSLGPALLRLKGRVLTDQGPWLLQMAPFELAPLVEKDTLPQSTDQARGLTVIVALPLSPAQMRLLLGLVGTA